jgi:hypothetical protein
LTVTKSSTPAAAGTYGAGQSVVYDFVVTNSGGVAIDNVRIEETGFSGSGVLSAVSCPASASTLDPAETATCTATYTLTQADVDSGSLINSARALGDPVGFPAGLSSAVSTTSLTITAAPAIGLVKSAPRVGSRVGDAADFAFAVTNLGNVTLSVLSVTETAFSGTGATPVPSCPPGTIAPGSTVTCTATYGLTRADIDAGALTNTADASASAPGGAVVTSASTVAAVIPDPPISGLALTGGGLLGGAVALGALLIAAGGWFLASRHPSPAPR